MWFAVVTWAIADEPDWLFLDPSGTLLWNNAEVGSGTFTLTATNAVGDDVSVINWTVVDVWGINDTFDYADSDLTDHPNWVEMDPALASPEVIDNAVTYETVDGDGSHALYVEAVPADADFFTEVEIRELTDGALNFQAMHVSYLQEGDQVFVGWNADTWLRGEAAGGDDISQPAVPHSLQSGDVVRVNVVGNSLSIYVNGVEQEELGWELTVRGGSVGILQQRTVGLSEPGSLERSTCGLLGGDLDGTISYGTGNTLVTYEGELVRYGV